MAITLPDTNYSGYPMEDGVYAAPPMPVGVELELSGPRTWPRLFIDDMKHSREPLFGDGANGAPDADGYINATGGTITYITSSVKMEAGTWVLTWNSTASGVCDLVNQAGDRVGTITVNSGGRREITIGAELSLGADQWVGVRVTNANVKPRLFLKQHEAALNSGKYIRPEVFQGLRHSSNAELWPHILSLTGWGGRDSRVSTAAQWRQVSYREWDPAPLAVIQELCTTAKPKSVRIDLPSRMSPAEVQTIRPLLRGAMAGAQHIYQTQAPEAIFLSQQFELKYAPVVNGNVQAEFTDGDLIVIYRMDDFAHGGFISATVEPPTFSGMSGASAANTSPLFLRYHSGEFRQINVRLDSFGSSGGSGGISYAVRVLYAQQPSARLALPSVKGLHYKAIGNSTSTIMESSPNRTILTVLYPNPLSLFLRAGDVPPIVAPDYAAIAAAINAERSYQRMNAVSSLSDLAFSKFITDDPSTPSPDDGVIVPIDWTKTFPEIAAQMQHPVNGLQIPFAPSFNDDDFVPVLNLVRKHTFSVGDAANSQRYQAEYENFVASATGQAMLVWICRVASGLGYHALIAGNLTLVAGMRGAYDELLELGGAPRGVPYVHGTTPAPPSGKRAQVRLTAEKYPPYSLFAGREAELAGARHFFYDAQITGKNGQTAQLHISPTGVPLIYGARNQDYTYGVEIIDPVTGEPGPTTEVSTPALTAFGFTVSLDDGRADLGNPVDVPAGQLVYAFEHVVRETFTVNFTNGVAVLNVPSWAPGSTHLIDATVTINGETLTLPPISVTAE